MGAMNVYVAAATQLAGALAAEGSAPSALARPRTALALLAVVAAALLVPLAVDALSLQGLVRACSASFVAVYVAATAAGVRLLDGAARWCAAVAFAAVVVVLAFSGPFVARPGRRRRGGGARACGASAAGACRLLTHYRGACAARRHRLLVLLAFTAPASAETFAEQPFTATPGNRIATCVRPTGVPGGLAQIGPLGRNSTATDLLRVTGAGTVLTGRVRLGLLTALPERRGGGRRRGRGRTRVAPENSIELRAAVRDAGGGFGAPVALGARRSVPC